MHDEPPHQLQQPRQQRYAASLAAATAAREEEDDRMDAEEEKEEKEEEERGEEEGYREKRKERGEGVEREEKATLTQGEGVINSDPSTTIIRPSGIEYPKAGLAMADGASAGEEVVTDVLTDSFGRQHSYLRISLTERCNLRCSYCMPAEGVELTPKEHLLSTDEVIRLAAVFVSQGVTKIRLTGGEPTVRRDIVDICQSLSALPGGEPTVRRDIVDICQSLSALPACAPAASTRLSTQPRHGAQPVPLLLPCCRQHVLPIFEAPHNLTSLISLCPCPCLPVPQGSVSTLALASNGILLPAKLPALREAGLTHLNVSLSTLALTSNGILLPAKLPALRAAGLTHLNVSLSTLALTSNGILLPAKLPALREAGLTHLNVSLDTLVEPRFELLTRRKGHARVLKAMDMSLDLGFKPLKLNCVVMRGVNDDEILDFVALTRDRPINVRFIEFMPFDGNVWKTKKMVPYAEIMARIRQRHASIARLRDHPSDTAKNFQVPGFAGSVSVISSMTSHFCSGCTRLRLLADGNLKVCLFGPNEVSLRDVLRQGATKEELLSLISAA
ncbi:unnamed protein product, partial [Closterium sp. NIES-64]